MDRKELDERRGVAEEGAASLKRAVPRIRLLNEPLRHHEPDGSLSADRASEPPASEWPSNRPPPPVTSRGRLKSLGRENSTRRN